MTRVKRPSPTERRALAHVIHWALINQRRPITAADHTSDEDPEYVEMQALHCPWYVPLEGEWGSDWGAIMHPSSDKFGQLVFEHEGCGCTHHESGLPEQVFGI